MSNTCAERILKTIFGLLVVASVGCNPQQNQVLIGSAHDQVVRVDEGDTELQQATKQARDSVDEFIAAMAEEKEVSEDDKDHVKRKFFVKREFRSDENIEFMWLKDVRYEGGTFVGTLFNDPTNVEAKVGEKFVVSPAEINDWRIVQGDKSSGGFTIPVLEQRAAAAKSK